MIFVQRISTIRCTDCSKSHRDERRLLGNTFELLVTDNTSSKKKTKNTNDRLLSGYIIFDAQSPISGTLLFCLY